MTVNSIRIFAYERAVNLAAVTLAVLGVVDLMRGYAHTFNLRQSAAHIAQIDTHPDALVLMGAFGNSNFLTAALFLLIAWQARHLAGWVLGLIPAAYLIGTIGMRMNDVVMASAFNGRYMLMVYFTVCLVVFTYFVLSRFSAAWQPAPGAGR